jgi:hypothetical protein
VSFVLTEALTLKKIQLLDVVLEGAGEKVDAANSGQIPQLTMPASTPTWPSPPVSCASCCRR